MKIDLRLHVMSFKNKMQIYERLLLTTFSQNKLDKPAQPGHLIFRCDL